MAELRVRLDDIAACELAESEPVRDDLDDGEAQLAIERFALSANNITYAAIGEQLGYWKLFPAPQGYGRIPAWGYARVIGSRAAGVAVGTRVLGLVPMGPRLSVLPKAHPAGFMDRSPHRAELAAVYNQYLLVEGDGDDAALVMRPLFGTSLVLDLSLSEAGFDDARTVVLTSASSKTAYGLAHLLRERAPRVVGLTSAGHREWVKGLGLYDEVLTYDDIDRLRAFGGAVLVDFAGNGDVVRAVHERLGDSLVRSIFVGFTHRRPGAGDEELPGPAREFFFAPDEIARRGPDLGHQYRVAWQRFVPVLGRALRIERITSGDDLLRVYRDLLEGRTDPALGCVVSLDED